MTDQDSNKPRRRGTRPGSIRQVRLRLWWAIQEAAELLEDPDKDTRVRAISALSTASGVYAKLTELSDLEKRIQALEARL